MTGNLFYGELYFTAYHSVFKEFYTCRVVIFFDIMAENPFNEVFYETCEKNQTAPLE